MEKLLKISEETKNTVGMVAKVIHSIDPNDLLLLQQEAKKVLIAEHYKATCELRDRIEKNLSKLQELTASEECTWKDRIANSIKETQFRLDVINYNIEKLKEQL